MTKQIENVGKIFVILLLVLLLTKACDAQTAQNRDSSLWHWHFSNYLDSADRYVNLKHCAMTCSPDSVGYYRAAILQYYTLMRYYYVLINGERSAKRIENDTTLDISHFDKCHCQP